MSIRVSTQDLSHRLADGESVRELFADGAVPATQPASLVDLLDRVLATGVVLSGDVTLCLAGVDLVTVKLRALITTVRGEEQP